MIGGGISKISPEFEVDKKFLISQEMVIVVFGYCYFRMGRVMNGCGASNVLDEYVGFWNAG
jgi:hypothetical protein